MTDHLRSFTVTFKGKKEKLSLPASTPLVALAAELGARFGVSPGTTKLLLPGGAKLALGQKPAAAVLGDSGIREGASLRLLASTAAGVEAVQAGRDLPGLAPLDHELARDLRRRGTAGGASGSAAPPPAGPYTFQRYEAWARPGLAPPPGDALRLLRALGADAGVAGVMARHRWTVGLLSEMPPEGKVGVSPVCILGVNVGRGAEISLRLRTDDLRGFRRYDRIRETLLHELAHMEHSDHGAAFKELNSRLRAECAELGWRGAPGARQLAGGGGTYEGEVQYDLPVEPLGAMAQTGRDSGKTLRQLSGGGEAAPAPRAPGSAAAAAALRRAGAGGAEPSAPAAAAATPSGSCPEASGMGRLGLGAGDQAGAAEERYRKGDAVLYRQRDGSWVEAEVAAVDVSVQPPSYGITFSGSGGYRETEGDRLQRRQPPAGGGGGGGEAAAAAAALPEGVGHRDPATEAAEERVRALLES